MTNGLTIRRAGPEDAQRWDDYVATSGSFFHRWGWGAAAQSVYGHEAVYLLAERGGRIVGGLPLIDRRSCLLGRALISVGFTTGGGVLAERQSDGLALLEAAEGEARDRGAGYIELRSPFGTADLWAEKTDIYEGFETAIISDEADRLKSIPRKKRADIRKAIAAAKNGDLTLSHNEDLGLFWQHFAIAQRDLGTPVFPARWLTSLKAAFGEDMSCTIIRSNDAPLAGVVTYRHRRTYHLYHAFVSPAARRTHAGDYLYWSMMGKAASEGIETFDLGRSKRGTGSHAYKTYWGFVPQPLIYQYRMMNGGPLPNVNPHNPKFALFAAGWKHLPLPVARHLGPVLAGHLA
ncbi:hypothetical protein PB2503_10539 [Parvularcula bermudensis HTCC2503]|uniref:N-acetyltransferase domain-containing protein n=1 Tax=Parvularcula bermudensis (strain ATCC BAA-594 / HTCC2503 / KCTC 12087) TaxID=314260 RepID=E0TGM7_PARBH|nr:FemAB family XrtA/PEP-CTERM system-associated protein [Parvularcula bermudensis]ADM10159.1 hypothetical protein PB2503_10539 [Parvularcula bermudensis HTCC2503]